MSTRPTAAPSPVAPAPVAAPEEFTRIPVLGIPLAITDYERAMQWIDDMVLTRRRGYLSAAAVHLVMVCQTDRDARAATLGADVVVPDGQPLVWALNMLGQRIRDRVYGPTLMARYCERSARTGTRMYLYGGRNQGALVQLALELRRHYPGLRIVGGYSPPFRPASDEERAAIVAEINASGADVVWVGTGQPKQEKWMAEMRDQLDAPVLIGVGAAFDFHAGLVPQAPNWMQDLGLEWLFRLAHEPRRLWRRYASDNPRFVLQFARQFLSHRRAARRAALPR